MNEETKKNPIQLVMEAKLAAETEEHQKTRQQLREALNNQEGDQDHGESN